MSWNTKNVTLFAIVGLILARPAHAQGQDGGGPDPTSPFITTASDADRALELRMAIGLGPMALAALDVNDSGYATLAHAGLTYYRQHRNELDAAFAQLMSAHAALANTLADNSDAADEADELLAAQEALEALLGGLVLQVQGGQNDPLPAYVARALLNTGLDSLVRLLDLQDSQRTALLTLTQQRSAVTHNPRLRHRCHAVAAAHQQFSQGLQQVLTAEQLNELNQLRQQAGASLEAIMQLELAFAAANTSPGGVGLGQPEGSPSQPAFEEAWQRFLRASASVFERVTTAASGAWTRSVKKAGQRQVTQADSKPPISGTLAAAK